MKRIGIIAVALILIVGAGLIGFGVNQSVSTRPEFYTGGYVLTGDTSEVKQLSFVADTTYSTGLSGTIQFTDTNGDKAEISTESFLHLDDGSIVALTDGVLFDFNDLSTNFINNYYITANLPITASNGTYVAETTSGTIEFGENLWKLSDNRYLIQSPSLSVYFAEDDIREVSDYIQVSFSEDGIVQLLTEENRWVTISESCYIQTEGGICVYPVTQIVDNGSYQMSLAKLSVSPDDSIVLTEDETRRQIVPEILIETIDGEDGESGEDGAEGTDGQIGTDGIDGQVGESGEQGIQGVEGEIGEDGAAGAAGAVGEDGILGEDGDEGDEGSNGKNGASGGSGLDGSDAGDSSVNSALPTVSITSWNVSASGLYGTMLISDTAECLLLYDEDYPFYVTIYNVETGEKIICYQYPSDDPDDADPDDGAAFTSTDPMDGMTWNFTTFDDPLDPDTAYELSITAYYTYGDGDTTNTVYSRELLSRTFYTDSTGVVLTLEDTTVDSIGVNVLLSSGYESTVTEAQVYLLTDTQNKDFTISTTSSGYTQMYTITYDSYDEQTGSITYEYWGDSTTNTVLEDGTFDASSYSSQLITFSGLDSDTEYVVRVIAKDNTGITKLTSQQIDVATLKHTPTWDTTDVPEAIYNRVTGAFEVFLPTITDMDGGVVSYTYTVYNKDGDVVSTKVLTPDRTGSASFYLTSETYYTFGVVMEFYDNEKTIYYDLGTSEPIMSVGDTMPSLQLTSTGTTLNDSNSWTGTLTVNFSGSTNALLDVNNNWTLSIYADQVWVEDITFNAEDDIVTDADVGRYSITSGAVNTNYLIFYLSFYNLLENVSYTINVTGAVDVNDGSVANDATVYPQRDLGSVTFRTTTTTQLLATYAVEDDATFDRSVRLTLVDGDSDAGEVVLTDAQKAAVLEDLKDGQVVIDLYSGDGNNKVYMESEIINDAASMSALYGDGLAITSSMFGTMSSVSSSAETLNYTLVISSVTDQTYALEDELGYVNEYDTPLKNTSIITVLPGPPDLLTAPENGVTVTEILNKNSNSYGKTVDPSLPDTAVVGYKLQATYDNGQRVGETITYYAFEANVAYDTIKAPADPIKSEVYIFSVTHDISSTSDSVPAVVIFFGDNPTESDFDATYDYADYTYTNGAYVHYAGDVVRNSTDTKIEEGMERGYQYLFAYTATYAVGEEGGHSYPYDITTSTKSYGDYLHTYGIGKPFSRSTENEGKDVVYMLNSGVVEAPKAEPTVYSFVEDNTTSITEGGYTSGKLDVAYYYDDPDGAINDETLLSYDVVTDASGTTQIMSPKMLIESNLENQWYSNTFYYNIFTESETSEVIVEILADWYEFEYETNMADWGWLDMGTEESILCQIPVEWGWGADFQAQRTLAEQDSSYKDKLVTLTVESVEEQNEIEFTLTANAAGSTYMTELYNRAYGLQVTLTPVNDTTLDSIETFLSLSLDTDSSSGRIYVAELSLTDIDGVENYIGKQLKVEATICYDDGTQGWSYIVDTDSEGDVTGAGQFALQYIEFNDDVAEFGNYYTITGTTGVSGYTNTALLQQYIDAENSDYPSSLVTITDLQNATNGTDAAVKFAIQNVLSSADIKAAYLFPRQLGMDFSFSSSISSASGYYAVPKGVGEHTFDTLKTVTVAQLTPTADDPSYEASRSSMTITNIPLVNGGNLLESALDDKLYLALYPDAISAGSLAADTLIETIELTVGTGGSLSFTDDDGYTVVFDDNLKEETTYYLAVYYIDDTDGTTKVFLLEKGTSTSAVFAIKTLGDMTISSSQEFVYSNNSYFEKTLSINYKLDRYSNITVTYDIFEGVTEPTYVPAENNTDYGTDYDEAILMSRTDLYGLASINNYESDGIITATSAYLNGTTVTFDLSPDEDRSEFVPGNTYWILIATYEYGTLAGSKYYSVTIDPAEKASSIIKVSNVTGNSMTFTVSVSDDSLSYMGIQDAITKDGYGRYAVRFFKQPDDSDSNDISTWDRISPTNADTIGDGTTGMLFDSTVFYSMGTAQQAFNLTGLDPESNYAIKVYAVYDEFHTDTSPEMLTGEVDETDESIVITTTADHETLFGDGTDDKPGTFQDYVDEYMTKAVTTKWYTDVYQAAVANQETTDELADIVAAKEAEIDDEDAKFCLISKSQTTASESGILVYEDMITISRLDPTTLNIYLAGSYGIIQGEDTKITQVVIDVTQYIDATNSVQWTITNDNPSFTNGTNSIGIDSYIYAIPETLGEGFYQFTITMYSESIASSGAVVTTAEVNAKSITYTD